MNNLVYALIFVSGIFSLSCNDSQESANDKNSRQGFELSQKYCTSCHLLPSPTLLNKVTWAEHVLPKMGTLLGFRRFASDYVAVSDTGTGGLTLEQWRNIVRYYVGGAPEESLEGPESAPRIQMHLPRFTVEMPGSNVKDPATTSVFIDTVKKNIIFADGSTEFCYTLSAGSLKDSVQVGIGVSSLYKYDSGFFALSMGVLYPSDTKSGNLVMVADNRKSLTLMESLQRPVHASYADLNADGLQDIVICEFGNTVGQLSWFEQTAPLTYAKHILRALPGSVKTEVFDFNRDGLPDIMALMAQGDEGMFIYYNKGKGSFKEQRILQFLPTYGSNHFELTDLNGDGFPDILASNGDNGDYPPILKSYHGIRIYLNNGKNEFSETVFLPVHGVGKVIARDFDADGDFDLASISYFPDYEKTPEESFIYWKNEGKLQFQPFSFPESIVGRWLTMDANDLDGDGDVDIVLGNAKFTLGAVPPAYMKKWNVHSPSVLILRNRLR